MFERKTLDLILYFPSIYEISNENIKEIEFYCPSE